MINLDLNNNIFFWCEKMTLPQLQEQLSEQSKPYARSASPSTEPPAKRVRVKEEPTEGSEQLKPYARSALPSTVLPPPNKRVRVARVATGTGGQKKIAVGETKTSFSDVPVYEKKQIFRFFSFSEKLNAALVCRDFKQAIYEQLEEEYKQTRAEFVSVRKELFREFNRNNEFSCQSSKYVELFPDYVTEDELLQLRKWSLDMSIDEIILSCSSIVTIETQTNGKDFLKKILSMLMTQFDRDKRSNKLDERLNKLLGSLADKIMPRFIRSNDLARISDLSPGEKSTIILLLQKGYKNLSLLLGIQDRDVVHYILQNVYKLFKWQQVGLVYTFEEFVEFMHKTLTSSEKTSRGQPTWQECRLMELKKKGIISNIGYLLRIADNLQDDCVRLLEHRQTDIVILDLYKAGVLQVLGRDFALLYGSRCEHKPSPLLPKFQVLLDKKLISSYSDLLSIPNLPAVCYVILCHLDSILLLKRKRLISNLKDFPDFVYADNSKILHLICTPFEFMTYKLPIVAYKIDGIINSLSDILSRNFEVLNIILGNYKRIVKFITDINSYFNLSDKKGFFQLSDAMITWLFDENNKNDRRVIAHFAKYKSDNHGFLPGIDPFKYLNQLGVAGMQDLLAHSENSAASKPKDIAPPPGMSMR